MNMILCSYLFKLTSLCVFHQTASSNRKTFFIITNKLISKQISCFLSSLAYTFVNAMTLRTNFGYVSKGTIFNTSLRYVRRSMSNQSIEAPYSVK